MRTSPRSLPTFDDGTLQVPAHIIDRLDLEVLTEGEGHCGLQRRQFRPDVSYVRRRQTGTGRDVASAWWWWRWSLGFLRRMSHSSPGSIYLSLVQGVSDGPGRLLALLAALHLPDPGVGRSGGVMLSRRLGRGVIVIVAWRQTVIDHQFTKCGEVH